MHILYTLCFFFGKYGVSNYCKGEKVNEKETFTNLTYGFIHQRFLSTIFYLLFSSDVHSEISSKFPLLNFLRLENRVHTAAQPSVAGCKDKLVPCCDFASLRDNRYGVTKEPNLLVVDFPVAS
jgi:hypothetical protein